MSQQEIIEALNVLAAVVKANSGLFGSESTTQKANEKIKELIPLLNR